MEHKDMKKATEELRQQGRNGDTVLAHINPKEAALLRLMGGSGTTNPKTGLPEFFESYYDFFGSPSFSDFYSAYTPVYEPPAALDPYGGSSDFTPVTLPTYEPPPLPVIQEAPPPVVFDAPNPIYTGPEVGPIDDTFTGQINRRSSSGWKLILGIAANFIAPGIGSALTGLAASTLTAQVVGAAVVQGALAEANGGDFIDGAIRGIVTAGVAPAIASTVGSSIAQTMTDSTVKSLVANTVASSVASAGAALLTEGDVGQAALTGALAGAAGTIGRQVGTAAELETSPFSEQTQMLAAQEQGLGTSGATGANVGTALGVTAAGGDATSAFTNALIKTLDEQRKAEATPVSENISNQPVLAPTEAEIAAPTAPETAPVQDVGLMDGVAGTIPEITPPSTQEIPIPDQISQELGGVQEGVAQTIPPLDQQILDLITQPSIPAEENPALDVLGQPLTPEAVGIEPIPQDPLLGLSAPAVGEGEQEAIDYQALEGLSDPSIGIGEQEAIDQANLDALDALSSAEVGQGEQQAIDQQALEDLALTEIGQGEQGVDLQPTPYTPDFYISTGRRRDFGPTVTTLGQALSAPFFPSTPVSGLTSYRGAGEIESQRTGKPRRNVWNESSLRLTDALGL